MKKGLGEALEACRQLAPQIQLDAYGLRMEEYRLHAVRPAYGGDLRRRVESARDTGSAGETRRADIAELLGFRGVFGHHSRGAAVLTAGHLHV